MRTAAVFPLVLSWLLWTGWSERRWDAHALASFAPELERRQALAEWMDRLVRAEHEHRARARRFTGILSRLNLETPGWILSDYATSIEADGSHFTLRLVSEDSGLLASTDERSSWRANFALPEPRAEFLAEQARQRPLAGYDGGLYRSYDRLADSRPRVPQPAAAGRRIASGDEGGAGFEVEALEAASPAPWEVEALAFPTEESR